MNDAGGAMRSGRDRVMSEALKVEDPNNAGPDALVLVRVYIVGWIDLFSDLFVDKVWC